VDKHARLLCPSAEESFHSITYVLVSSSSMENSEEALVSLAEERLDEGRIAQGCIHELLQQAPQPHYRLACICQPNDKGMFSSYENTQYYRTAFNTCHL
jgi:hypothetical protein